MDLITDDQFAQSLAALTPAPDHHTPGLGDDLDAFVHDLGQPGLGNTGRAFRAAAASAFENDTSLGGDWTMRQQYEPLVEAINKDRPFLDRVANPYWAMLDPRSYLHTGIFASQGDYEDYFWKQADAARARDPETFGNLPRNKGELLDAVRAEQRASHDYAATLAANGGPVTGTAANFAGSAVGNFVDPPNLMASVLGFPASESLLKTALIEGAGNAAIDLAGLPRRAAHYADIGLSFSAGDMAAEVGGSTVLGAGLGVGGKLVARLLGLGGHDLVREFEAQNPDPPPSLRTAANMVEDRANLDATNPFADTPEGRDLHRQAMMAAQAALDERAPDLLPDLADDAARQIGGRLEAAIAFSDEQASPRSRALDAAGRIRSALAEVDNLMMAQKAELPDGAVPRNAARAAFTQGRLGELTPEARALLAPDGKVSQQSLAALYDQMRAWEQAAREAGASEIAATFSTAKGSRYALHADGTTTRDKAPRPEHPGEAGPQPRSEATYFVTPEAADALSLIQAQGGRPMAIHSTADRLAIRYRDVPHLQIEKRTIVPYSREPVPGMIPVEIWRNGEVVHFGNPVVDVREPPAPPDIAASRGQHTPSHDPENLKRFADPIRKPKAFRAQADDLAREVAPAPEAPPGTQRDSATGKGEKSGPDTSGREAAASGAPEGPGGESPFGDAAAQIEALRRLPDGDLFADPATGGESTIRAARLEIERQARAVERLRGCATGEN